MGEIIFIKGTGGRSAEAVLIALGFRVVSPWGDGNRYERDGKLYRIAHPVWRDSDVRIEEVES